MLDFNQHSKFHERVTSHIDASLDAERAEQKARTYLGASRLGVECERALQYEYAGAPNDLGRGFSSRILRIFEVGHVMEELAVRWLRMAGFELHNQKPDGGQFGFSAAAGRLQGHVDGIITAAPVDLGLSFPMLFECKTMNDKNWRNTVKNGVAVAKPVYAAQMAIYQAYMEESVKGISGNPALFIAINKDTQELWFELVPFDAALAQRMSDRALKVITATDAGEQLNRAYQDPTHFECRMCAWQDRCWRQKNDRH